MKRFLSIIGVLVLVVVAFAAGAFFVLPYTPPAARPPVVQPQALVSSAHPVMIMVNTASITEAGSFIGGYDWASAGYSLADMYYSIDQADGNNITLTLQVSPDNSTWVDHAISSTLVADNSADASGYVGGVSIQLPYFRITSTVTGTNAVTPTIKVYLR